MNRSAQDSLRPYFCLIGHSSRRALSRLALSGQLFSGANRCCPPPAAAAPVRRAVGPRAVPRHADEQPAVMAEIRRPPLLRIRHQRMQVRDHRVQIEAVELLRVIERPAHRVSLRRMLVQALQAQLLRPPVPVAPPAPPPRATAAAAAERTLARPLLARHPVHRSLLSNRLAPPAPGGTDASCHRPRRRLAPPRAHVKLIIADPPIDPVDHNRRTHAGKCARTVSANSCTSRTRG